MKPSVHPRIRGERRVIRVAGFNDTGSSPHTRGTRQSDPTSAAASTVHPRIRGERTTRMTENSFRAGSSPHTRGTLGIEYVCFAVCRFIPAYAGNASAPGPTATALPVHPRIRGERAPTPTHRGKTPGSSPHTRGTRTYANTQGQDPRFIPAYAGNAPGARVEHEIEAVHPRIRGERTSNKLLIYQGKIAPSDSTKHSAC